MADTFLDRLIVVDIIVVDIIVVDIIVVNIPRASQSLIDICMCLQVLHDVTFACAYKCFMM